MEVYLNYALGTGNPVSERRSGGEVIKIPNTFKEAMESPQVSKWEESTRKEMDSLQKNAVFNPMSRDAVPTEHKAIGTKCVFTLKADHTLKGKVVVQCWGQLPAIDCGRTYLPHSEHPHGTRHFYE